MTTDYGECKNLSHSPNLSGKRPTCPQCDAAKAAADEAAIPPSTDEWATFKAALIKARRVDGTVHQCDVRPHIRGVIEPKHIGTFWRRARSEGLVTELGHERSNDTAGRNAGRMEPYYELRSAA